MAQGQKGSAQVGLAWHEHLDFQLDVLKLAAPVLERIPGRTSHPRMPAPTYRAGLIGNRKSHRNKTAGKLRAPSGSGSELLVRHPQSIAALTEALIDFANAGIELLIVDGGDGTVRDVITCAAQTFPDGVPQIAVVPAGKTNALAQDLGIPHNWTVEDALRAQRQGKLVERAPLEIVRAGSQMPALKGFLFGAGAFVRATSLAQRTHKMGAFNNLAVGVSLAAAIGQTMFGGEQNDWRRGEAMRIGRDGQLVHDHFYLLLASALNSLPMGLKPFGSLESDLRLLAIDAPPRKVLSSLRPLLFGSDDPLLARHGYHRMGVDAFDLELDSGFILDGELYHGGAFTVRRGTPLRFVVP
ncbi:hypothetical protein B5C34_12510 [Pacificimonas flava]|uniref:DAGKc domain-containing protein n=2 Tax=Pacificimonas TaxID=1960290 RepID=A0A219B7V8_9SPHN|nr:MULTISPECIES: diacylglycerol kinase family protein [Pacificimonas]MBZ6378512.1 NAD(+)/NADH kinase [Pacificimonas aurantium]OWV34196.1 hypothetical protein B5C34_12510 [Pacificimonas flava]